MNTKHESMKAWNYETMKAWKENNKGNVLTITGYPRFKGRCYTCGNFRRNSVNGPDKKNVSENDANEKGRDIMAVLRIVEYGVTNTRTIGTLKKQQESQKNDIESANMT